ncbi:MAG: phosphotriesterase-related protein [Chloroflexi bacterium]|nr:phosphotriesterase-related protein [Chloroflexota bacterium]
MSLISIRGAIDLHMHPYPDLFPRLADDREVAQAAVQAGLRAILLKCHVESTASRAYLLRAEFPDISIFGGIVLNTYVGGINPAAVEACLQLGGKEVWMPTIDSHYHAQIHGSTGRYDVQAGASTSKEGITILYDGRLVPEVHEVLELIAQHEAILGTAHLSPAEIQALVRAAREHKVERILITHPYFKVPNLDLPFLQEMVRLGAKAEFGYCTVSSMWAYASVDKIKSSIQALGASNCVLMSDAGQTHNPLPPEALRLFAQMLYEKGIAEAELETMLIKNPSWLLNLR